MYPLATARHFDSFAASLHIDELKLTRRMIKMTDQLSGRIDKLRRNAENAAVREEQRKIDEATKAEAKRKSVEIVTEKWRADEKDIQAVAKELNATDPKPRPFRRFVFVSTTPEIPDSIGSATFIVDYDSTRQAGIRFDVRSGGKIFVSGLPNTRVQVREKEYEIINLQKSDYVRIVMDFVDQVQAYALE